MPVAGNSNTKFVPGPVLGRDPGEGLELDVRLRLGVG